MLDYALSTSDEGLFFTSNFGEWDDCVVTSISDASFANEEIVVGESIDGDWSCEASEPLEGAETFYASYESVFVFNCTGGGLEGEWVFANGLGLVQYLSPDASSGLELVAPW